MIYSNQKLQINDQTSSLPPGFQNLSTFCFGKLIIQLNIQQLKQILINKFSFEFLGANSQTFTLKSNMKTFQFPIKTSLWHFYQYLTDMQFIKINLKTFEGQQYYCKKQLQLLSTDKVLNKNYIKGNYIANSVELCDIFDKNNINKGYVMVKVKLDFQQQLHQQISEIIDFSSIIINPQIINIKNQKNQRQKSINQLKKEKLSLQNSFKNKIGFNQQNLPNISNIHQSENLYSNIKHVQEQDSRIIQDDIDRMIAEMQNKPYDSSRYVENNPNNSFIKTQSEAFFPQNTIRNNFHLTQSSVGSRVQNNQGYNENRSKSPLNHNKFPPLPNNKPQIIGIQFPGNTTIYSQKSVSPLNKSNRSLSRKQKLQHQNLSRTINQSNFNGSKVSQSVNRNNGMLKIQIHELMGKDIQDEDFILKIYINNEKEQILNCRGSLNGQVIIFNQKTQICQCNLNQIQKIVFQLQNLDNQILYSSIFQMNRLLNVPKLQGIFMLNFYSLNQQFYGNSLIASQSLLKNIQKPNQRTLRVSFSYSEQLQVIQIYINITKFTINFKKCKYKIPFTKQTVQFQATNSHFNIFPHSKAFTKLILQFWDQKSIIGVSQICLNNLKNINKSVLECNIQPICLYDSMVTINNIITKNLVGKYKLLLCCGNVRQIQHVLNKNMQNKQSQKQLNRSLNLQNNKVQVQYDKKLGIYVKDRKNKQQIQIQVDTTQLVQEKSLKLKKLYSEPLNHKQTQNKEIDQKDSMASQNQFLHQDQKISSRIKQMGLSQQQQIQDQDQQQQQKQIKYHKIQNLNNIKKQQVKKIQLVKKLPQKIKQQQKKPLKNLSQIIYKKIEQSFYPLIENNFQRFKRLKIVCKPHLLFNFIQIDNLIKKLIDVGISYKYINKILQILHPVNGMVNFNLLNDYIVNLQVQGKIKQNLVSNKLFVKLLLQEYYEASCLQIQQQQSRITQSYLQNNNQNINYKNNFQNWLSQPILSQISILDQSIDFSDFRKIFNSLNYKISMNDYNILKDFLQKQSQIKDFLYDLSQSKQSYERILKSKTNIYQILKLTIIQEIIKKKKQQQINENYEDDILNKIYGSRISSQMNNQSLISSRVSEQNQYTMKKHQQKIVNRTDNEFGFKKQQLKEINYKRKQQHFDDEDQDDFIINGLNAKQVIIQKKQNDFTKNKLIQNVKFIQNISKNQCISSKEYSKDINNQSQFKQTNYKGKLNNFTKNNINNFNSHLSKRNITVDGLQSCKSTYECQLDLQLISPYLKINIYNPFTQKFYFKQSDTENIQQFECQINIDDVQIQGQINLMDLGYQGQIKIAAARFVVLKNIKSVYALKTIKQQAFCGLVNILIE